MKTEQWARRPLRLTDDLVFKAVYGREDPACKKALIALLNLVLDRKEDPIVSIEYKNPFSLREYSLEKESILDIKAETEKRELIDIEMQAEKFAVYANRSVYYQAKLIIEGLEKGQDYDKMKKSVMISFIDGIMFRQTPDCHSFFRYKEVHRGFEFTDISEIHFIELGKIDPQKTVSEMEPIERLGAYMKYATEEKMAEYVARLIESGEEAIQLTEPLLRKATEDEILREKQRAHDLWEHDQATIRVMWERERLKELKIEVQKKAEKELERKLKRKKEEDARTLVKTLAGLGVSREVVRQKLLEDFAMTQTAAEKALEAYPQE